MKNNLKQLQKENKFIIKKLNEFCDDFKMVDSREDLFDLIYKLVDNEIQQEKECNQ